MKMKKGTGPLPSPKNVMTPGTLERSRPLFQRGFTLVELLVVIALIGVMALLAVLFIPSINTKARAARGAGDLQTWLNTARQRAIRDQRPIGLRILFEQANVRMAKYPTDPLIGSTRCQFVEQPDDVGSQRFLDASNGLVDLILAPFPQPPGSPLPNQVWACTQSPTTGALTHSANFGDGSVLVGDYLEITGSNQPHYIAAISPSDPKNFPQYNDLLTLASSLPNGISTNVKNFRIMRQPRPTGDEAFDLPDKVVIDAATNGFYGAPAPRFVITSKDVNGITTSGYVDIVFTPTGSVMRQNVSSDKIYFWVRSTDNDVGNESVLGEDYGDTYPRPDPSRLRFFRNEPTLIVVYVDSGLVAAYPVDTSNPVNPYGLVRP